MRLKKYVAAVLLLLLLWALTGCGGRTQAQQDEPTEFMAWQFAQAIVKQRMVRPNNTVFPRYSYATVEREGNTFTISSSVTSRDREDNPIGFDFTVVVKYVGNDVFEEVSVKLTQRE